MTAAGAACMKQCVGLDCDPMRPTIRVDVTAWETQAVMRRGPSPENPHPNTAIFGRERSETFE